MDPREYFELADRLPVAGIGDLLGGGGAVVIAPHPDDRTLGCGALIATAVARRKAVRVIVVSDGVGSHPSSKTHPPERLRALREREAREAALTLRLAPRDVRFLRLPDREVPSAGLLAEQAAAAVAEEARAIGASALFVTWRHDPHCDHQSSYAIARHAQATSGLRLFEYPVWGRTLPLDYSLPDRPRGWQFASQQMRERKRAAILCHRSQTTDLIEDDPGGFRLTDSMIEEFLARDELFLESPP